MNGTDPTSQTYRDGASDYLRRAQLLGELPAPIWGQVAARTVAPCRVVDLGAGPGADAEALARRGHHVTAVDASVPMCRLAAGHGNARVVCAKVEEVPLPDGCADLVTCVAVLHHVPSALWPQVAGEWFRLLRPGGLLAVSTAYGADGVQTREAAPWGGVRTFRLASPQRVAALVTAAGLDVVSLRVVSAGRRFVDCVAVRPTV